MSLENEPRPSMREIVLAEIEAWHKQNERDEAGKISNYINNFPEHLPDRNGKSAQNYCDEDEKLFPTDIPIYRAIKMPNETDEESLQGFIKEGYSEKYYMGSKEDFNRDVDRAITQSGVDREKLIAFIDDCIKKGGWPQQHAAGNLPVLKGLILPVYIALREMGYSHRDLY